MCRLIIVVIYMGHGRAYWLGGDFKVITWDASHKELGQFLGGNWCKDANLAIGGGLGWMKLLKNEAGKSFIFHANIPALFHFWWKFYWLSLYSVRLNLNYEKTIVTNMWRLKRWWHLSKCLTITITSLILVTFSAVL